MLKDKVIQVEKSTISQKIVQQLIDLILNGTIGAGERLPSEKELMEMFGVGRSSLREAIRALIVLGLVEVRVPEGTFVSHSLGNFFTKHLGLMSKISFDNIVELVEARIAIEVDIAEIAARKATPEQCEELQALVRQMRETGDNNERFMQADVRFHAALAEISQNSFMLHVQSILRDITRQWIMEVIQLQSSKDLAADQHEQIAEAIRRGDPEAAGKRMAEHLETVSRLLFEQQQRKSP